uniref:EGF-like domain-containing protein n=1 Tax=Romanomermis culicivorax TaxID=13658 RepID=A0A915JQP4_ROMCU
MQMSPAGQDKSFVLSNTDETTQTTSTGSMTTFAPPAAPIDRHDAPPPENAAGYSTNAGNPDAKTCQSAGGSACHPNAQCHDSAVGYCCQCSYGYYGNGIECLPNGENLNAPKL